MSNDNEHAKISVVTGIRIFIIITVLFAFAACSYERSPKTAAEPPVEQPQIVEGSNFSAHFIDVGQGDCSLLICGGEAMLIDAGEAFAAESVINYIKGMGVDELAYVVAPHPHSDHIGGLPAVIGEFPVKTFITPDITHTTKTFENLLDALENNNVEITLAEPFDEYRLGEAVLTVLWPDGKEHDDLNNYSVVLKADYGDNSFLFTGDAENEAEKGILESADGIKSDVIKVGHHGSQSSTTGAFIDTVAPEAAVISCGKDNTYGHPHDKTVQKLENKKIEIYRTDISGTIIIESDGKNLAIRTEK